MKERVEHILNSIRKAAGNCGRDPESVKLIAVSKTVPADTVRKAIHAGITVLGENYLQEARNKIETLADETVSWHFIGHLQSNKAKYAVGLFDLIHSVDSLKLARELNRQAKKIDKIQNILVQVNISREVTKSGTTIEQALQLIEDISRLENLSVRGLMTLPPFFDDPDNARPYFAALRELRDTIRKKASPNVVMEELSMGMSGDFEAAIQEGATLVRIGTAIFGRRD